MYDANHEENESDAYKLGRKGIPFRNWLHFFIRSVNSQHSKQFTYVEYSRDLFVFDARLAFEEHDLEFL